MAGAGRSVGALFATPLRRGVLQTLGVYLVAAWATIEVASTILPYFGVADSVVTAIIVMAAACAPVVAALAWAFDVTPEGLERVDVDPAASRPVVRVRWGRLPLAAALVVVATSLAGVAWIRSTESRLTDPGAVAVFPFRVSGDSTLVGQLGEGMVTLVSRELDGVAGLRGVDPNTILSLADRDPRVGVDPEVARSIASGIGATRFILGTVTEVAGRVAVSARLYGEGGVELATASVEGAFSAAFGLAEDLVAQLLAQQVGPLSRQLSRTAAHDTESLAAFKAFVDAERDLRQTRRDEAIAGFQRAVAQDSTFALAYYRLAVAAGFRRNYRLVASSLERATAFGDRLSDRDRRLLEAFVAFREGRIDDAEGLYWAIIEDYPDAWEARFQLGELLTEHNPARGRPASEGRALLQAVTRADPAFNCPTCTLANHALSRREIDLADSIQYARVPIERFAAYAAASAAARDDSVAFARWYRAGMNLAWQGPWLAAWFEAFDWAERVIRPSTGPDRNPTVRVHALFSLADLLAAGGRWREVEELLARAEELSPGRARLRRAFYAGHAIAGGPDGQLDRAVAEITSWSGTEGGFPDLESPLSPLLPLGRPYLLGLLESRRGNPNMALAWADSVDASAEPTDARGLAHDLALTIRADVALGAGRPSDAIRLLDGIRGQIPVNVMDLVSCGPARLEFADLFTEEQARLLRIRALLELGRANEARQWLENGFFRLGGNVVLTPTLRRLGGDVYAGLGDGARARDEYQRFLTMWRGDADVEAVADSVRARLASIS